MATEEINISVEKGVATFNSGRNKGWVVAISTTARLVLSGHSGRANSMDAQALAAGYLDLEAKLRAYEHERQLFQAELTVLKGTSTPVIKTAECQHVPKKDRGGPNDDEVIRCTKCGDYLEGK